MIVLITDGYDTKRLKIETDIYTFKALIISRVSFECKLVFYDFLTSAYLVIQQSCILLLIMI